MAVIIAVLVKKYRQLTPRLSASAVPSSATRTHDYESVDLSLASHTPRPAEYETPVLSAEEPVTAVTKNMAYTTWLPPTEELTFHNEAYMHCSDNPVGSEGEAAIESEISDPSTFQNEAYMSLHCPGNPVGSGGEATLGTCVVSMETGDVVSDEIRGALPDKGHGETDSAGYEIVDTLV